MKDEPTLRDVRGRCGPNLAEFQQCHGCHWWDIASMVNQHVQYQWAVLKLANCFSLPEVGISLGNLPQFSPLRRQARPDLLLIVAGGGSVELMLGAIPSDSPSWCGWNPSVFGWKPKNGRGFRDVFLDLEPKWPILQVRTCNRRVSSSLKDSPALWFRAPRSQKWSLFPRLSPQFCSSKPLVWVISPEFIKTLTYVR